ncbi:MAG: steroid 5-alpha reductase family enzyme [Bacteroidia bacterium]|jgi:steroid 5-alpha reductase family enzyme
MNLRMLNSIFFTQRYIATKNHHMQFEKGASIFIQVIAYSLATLIALLTWNFLPEMEDLWRLAAADVAATVFIFLCSMIFNNSSMYDPYWSIKPAVIAAGYAFIFGLSSIASIALFALMILYNLRLTTNFFRDWGGLKHEDWRYRNFRDQFPKAYWAVSFSGIHLFPTIMVYLACIPLYFGMKQSFEMSWLGWLGILITIAAVLIAYTADEQMRSFRSHPDNKGKNMNVGLWKHSRHPNYLGELLTWWGIYLVALDASSDYWWTGVGALAITVMFVFISIPLMDNRSLKRRPNFEEHMKRTRAILPIPVN